MPRRTHLPTSLLAACLATFALAPAGSFAGDDDAIGTRPPPPSERDDERRDDRGDRRDDGRRDRDGDRDDDDRRDRRPPPTSVEWEQTRQFLAAHAPTRLDMYERFEEFARERMDDDDGDIEAFGPVQRLRSRIHEHVASLQKQIEHEPRDGQFALRQFETEDRLLGAMVVAARMRGEAGHEEAAAEVEAVSREYVEQTLAERQARLERMSEELERERERLARDRGRVEEMAQEVAEKFRRYLPPHLRGGERGERGDDARGRRRGGPGGPPPSTRPNDG